MITIREVTGDSRGMKDFINLQYDLYRNDPMFVPPLRIERSQFFNPKKNPFFEHAEIAFYVAYREKQPVGRITAHIDHNYNTYHKINQGFFGFYEAIEDQEVCNLLLAEAEKWCRSKGVVSIIGPMNFSTNHESPGFLIKGFDTPPVLMMTHTKPYYAKQVTAAGYSKEKLLIAYYLKDVKKVPDIVAEHYTKIMAKHGADIEIRRIDMKNLKNEVRIILNIFNQAWCNNWGYVPMTEKEINQMAAELKLIAVPDIIYIVYKSGEPVAFQLAFPDINMVLHKIKDGRLSIAAIWKLLFGRKIINTLRVPLMGVLPKYRRLGLDFLMYNDIFLDGLKMMGQGNVEMSWILEDNRMMNAALLKLGSDPYKEYLIVSKALS